MKARAKSGKVKLSPEIREAMEAEADRMAKLAIKEMVDKNEIEIDCMILYILRTEFGFGEKRLRKFYDMFSSGLRDLGRRYEMNEYEDRLWLAERALKDSGIDISKWKEGAADESRKSDPAQEGEA